MRTFQTNFYANTCLQDTQKANAKTEWKQNQMSREQRTHTKNPYGH